MYATCAAELSWSSSSSRGVETKLVVEGGELVFYTDEPPVRGRANAALLKLLKRALKADVEIVRGERDRVKLVYVRGLGAAEVSRRLAEALGN